MLFLSYLYFILLIVGTVDNGYNHLIDRGIFLKKEVENWGEKTGIKLGTTGDLYVLTWMGALLKAVPV